MIKNRIERYNRKSFKKEDSGNFDMFTLGRTTVSYSPTEEKKISLGVDINILLGMSNDEFFQLSNPTL